MRGFSFISQHGLTDLYSNQLALTALDLNNEIHDSVSPIHGRAWRPWLKVVHQHHPVAVSLYYEDQKEESKRKSKNIREERIPKFLGYFANVLKANGNGVLVGHKISYADLVLFQVVDGMQFAFPKRLKALEQDQQYKPVFDLKRKIADSEGVAAYLKSDRRQEYSMGVFVSSDLFRRDDGLIDHPSGTTPSWTTIEGPRPAGKPI